MVALPRDGIQPLDVLGRDRSTERLGPITDFVEVMGPLPVATRHATASLDAVQSSELSLKVGLRVLARFLGLSGSGPSGLDTAFSGAQSLRFHFNQPISESINPSALDTWLAGVTPVPYSLLHRYITKGNSAAYVVTEALKVRDFSIEAKFEEETRTKIGLEDIQTSLGVNAEFAASTDRLGHVDYRGSKLLTFGFKAFQIVYSAFRLGLKDVKAGRISLGADETPGTGAVILGDGLFELSSPRHL